MILDAFSRSIQIFVARFLSPVGLAVIGGIGLLTMVREEVRLGTVRGNPFSRTRL
nr:hypothetical protein [Mesorhizobium sp.]